MRRILGFFLLALSSFNFPSNYTLTINITGFPNNVGKAHIGVYNSAKTFPEYGKQFKGKVGEIKNQKVSINFDNLPKGSYGVAVYQDENKNGKLDKNLVGYPTEAFGFSNNFRPTISAPDFEDVAFSLDKSKTITIHVK